ncbi:hypothetical protein F5Y16DRAFT_388359 [Xylariaceae sp. FL0255]|nr:hypothetical protein F5Y16DRAFT_388359 [Xylariaceae sp. FL0255]
MGHATPITLNPYEVASNATLSRLPQTSFHSDEESLEQCQCNSAQTPNLEYGSDSSNNSDNDSDDDDDLYLFNGSPSPKPGVLLNTDLARDTEELTNIAMAEFLSATISPPSKSKRGSDLKLSGSIRKRLKNTCYRNPFGVGHFTEAVDGDTVILTSPPSFTTHYLACPFYVRDQRANPSCLTRAGLREFKDLKKHLWNAHRRPPYCPICCETFPSTAASNQHIRSRSCKSSSKPRPTGITALQMQQLERRSYPRASQELQWLSIWQIMFPSAKLPSPSSTYLWGETEAMVCVLRDFWSTEGTRIVANFLTGKTSNSLLSSNDFQVQSLSRAVLNRLIDELVAC